MKDMSNTNFAGMTSNEAFNYFNESLDHITWGIGMEEALFTIEDVLCEVADEDQVVELYKSIDPEDFEGMQEYRVALNSAVSELFEFWLGKIHDILQNCEPLEPLVLDEDVLEYLKIHRKSLDLLTSQLEKYDTLTDKILHGVRLVREDEYRRELAMFSVELERLEL